MIWRWALPIAWICCLGSTAFGQPVAARVFEVASVKEQPPPFPYLGISTSGARLTGLSNVYGLILEAYNLKRYQLSFMATASAATGAFYNIAAKAEGDGTPTRDEFRQMLQALLAERFKLKVHHEAKEIPVYDLVVAKGGPRFKESDPEADSVSRHNVRGRNYEITMPKATSGELADEISGSWGMDRPVFDKTGLAGMWDVRFIYTPDLQANRAEPDPNDVSIFAAVEKLGLRLEPRKAMIDVLIVDSVEKPSEN